MASIQITIFRCDRTSTAVGNTSEATTWILAQALVSVRSELHAGDDLDLYLADLYTDDAVALEQLAAGNFATEVATMQYQASDASETYRVMVGGVQVLEIVVANAPASQSPARPYGGRLHQAVNETAQWLDLDFTYVVRQSTFSPTQVTANEGALRAWAGPASTQEFLSTRAAPDGAVTLLPGILAS